MPVQNLPVFFWLIIGLMAEYNTLRTEESHTKFPSWLADWHYGEINTLAILQWYEGMHQLGTEIKSSVSCTY